MYCTNCGKEIQNGISVCPYCNKVFKRVKTQESSIEKRYQRIYINPEEKLIATLGNGYLENFIFQRIGKCNALLTDRRIYLQGMYIQNGRKANKEQIIEMGDVTGTGFICENNIKLLIISLACMVCGVIGFFAENVLSLLFVVGLIAMAVYFVSKTTYFAIEYAEDGSINEYTTKEYFDRNQREKE